MANLIHKLSISKIRLNNICQDQRGQDMTEYALIGGLMASMTVAIVPEMLSLAQHVVSIFQEVAKVALRLAVE